MTAPDDPDFERLVRRAEAERRAELNADLGDEMAGRETGRIKRFLPGEASLETQKKRERDVDRQFMSLLDQLLLDPVYRARYEAFGVFLASAETRADRLLDEAEDALSAIREKTESMLDQASRLPDGRRVFRSSDGRVIDEHGQAVSDDDAASVVWRDGAPTAEAYLEARRKERDIQAHLIELQKLRTDLGGVRDRYTDPDNPLTIQEMDEHQSLIEHHLFEMEASASFNPLLNSPEDPAFKASTSIIKPIL